MAEIMFLFCLKPIILIDDIKLHNTEPFLVISTLLHILYDHNLGFETTALIWEVFDTNNNL